RADERRARPATPFAFFLNMMFSFDSLRSAQLALPNAAANGRSEPGELVEPLDVIRFAVEPLARLALRRFRLASDCSRSAACRDADPRELEEAATVGDRLVILSLHFQLLLLANCPNFYSRS